MEFHGGQVAVQFNCQSPDGQGMLVVACCLHDAGNELLRTL